MKKTLNRKLTERQRNIRKVKNIALPILLPLFSCLSCSHDNYTYRMNHLFATIENNDKGMGGVSVFVDGKEAYNRNYGYADVENKKKADSKTKYRVGSITKTFTAVVIMKLCENEMLSLSSKLKEFCPDVENADEISVEDLMRHRSGVANFTAATDYLEWNTMAVSKEKLLSRIVSGGSDFKPGEKAQYSNSNYVLLYFIAEKVANRSFSDLLDEMILKPCGLKNTLVGAKINPKKNEAYSYEKINGWVRHSETDMSIPLGSGNMISTPHDLNVFMNSLFTGKILSSESLETICTLNDGIGAGLFGMPFDDLSGYGHTGVIDEFHSTVCYLPEKKISVAVTANGIVYPVNDILVDVLSLFLEK